MSDKLNGSTRFLDALISRLISDLKEAKSIGMEKRHAVKLLEEAIKQSRNIAPAKELQAAHNVCTEAINEIFKENSEPLWVPLDLVDLEQFFTEELNQEKAKGRSKKGCLLRLQSMIISAELKGLLKNSRKETEELLMRLLNKIYADDPAVDKHEIDTADIASYDFRGRIRESKQTKKEWQKRATDDYLEDISDGVPKGVCYEALEIKLEIIDEEYSDPQSESIAVKA